MIETTYTHPFEGFLETARFLADAHISAEVVAEQKRNAVAKTIRQLAELGCPVDEISEATGWTPKDITALLERDQADELAALAGIR